MSLLRQQLGCWLNERWRAELILEFPSLARVLGLSWLDLCNRSERLSVDSHHDGRVCHWEESSPLTVARLFPDVGHRLLKHCLNIWPVELNFESKHVSLSPPEVSVLIAIGGTERLPLLKMVLASLQAQTHPAYEIIVVEQSERAQLIGSLPENIIYEHSPDPDCDQRFNKSHALNSAARLARGQVLCIHDGDLVVPRGYLVEACRLLGNADAVRPARLLFYLSRKTTQEMIEDACQAHSGSLESVVQNSPNPLVVTAEAYWRVGGNDESYVGWGGEDTEFLSRLRTGTVREGGTLPVIHLWHPPAPKKESGDRNRQLHREKELLTPEQRIERLLAARN